MMLPNEAECIKAKSTRKQGVSSANLSSRIPIVLSNNKGMRGDPQNTYRIYTGYKLYLPIMVSYRRVPIKSCLLLARDVSEFNNGPRAGIKALYCLR